MTGCGAMSNKKISVSISVDVNNIPSYDLFIVKTTDDYMEVQLAKKREDKKEIKVSVDNVFRIKKDLMFDFAYQVVKSLPSSADHKDD